MIDCLYTGPAASRMDCWHGYEPPWLTRMLAEYLTELDLRDFRATAVEPIWVDAVTFNAIKAGRDIGIVALDEPGTYDMDNPLVLPYAAFNWNKEPESCE